MEEILAFTLSPHIQLSCCSVDATRALWATIRLLTHAFILWVRFNYLNIWKALGYLKQLHDTYIYEIWFVGHPYLSRQEELFLKYRCLYKANEMQFMSKMVYVSKSQGQEREEICFLISKQKATNQPTGQLSKNPGFLSRIFILDKNCCPPVFFKVFTKRRRTVMK